MAQLVECVCMVCFCFFVFFFFFLFLLCIGNPQGSQCWIAGLRGGSIGNAGWRLFLEIKTCWTSRHSRFPLSESRFGADSENVE